MSSDHYSADKAAGTKPEPTNPGSACCCEELKQSVADRLQRAAAALNKTAAEQEGNSELAEFEKQAAQWLNQSSEYIRQFDYEQEQANVRSHIVRNPGRSLAIAGVTGLVLGILLRR